MRILQSRSLRTSRDTMSLSDRFADVADALAPAFDLVDDIDEPSADVIAFPVRLRLVDANVRVRSDIPTPPWGGAA